MLFSELGKQSRVTIDGETMSGPEYCNEIITSLCNTAVSTEDAVAFAAVLRELKISSNSTSRLFLITLILTYNYCTQHRCILLCFLVNFKKF